MPKIDVTTGDWSSYVLGPDRTIPEDIADKHLVASADGTRVVLYQWRQWNNGRPTILFQHANGFNAGVYLPFLQRISARCNIFAVDLRGHGASDKPEPTAFENGRDNYAPAASGEDMSALRQYINGLIGDDAAIHLVSHSQGGIGSIIYAAANGSDAFASMTMFEPPLLPMAGPGVAPSLRRATNFADWAARRKMRFASAEDFEIEFDAIQTYKTFDPEMRRSHLIGLVAKTGTGFELRCPGIVESQVYLSNAARPVSNLVADVSVPGILYSSDPAISRAHGWYEFFKDITERSPGIAPAIMNGCRHLMVQEDPHTCVAAVFKQVFRT